MWNLGFGWVKKRWDESDSFRPVALCAGRTLASYEQDRSMLESPFGWVSRNLVGQARLTSA